MRAILFIVAGCVLAFGQEPEQPLFKAGVADVRVDAQVMQKGRILDGLVREDFVIFDNNESRPLVYFGHEREPLALLLLLDVSGSMSKSLEQLTSASQAALAQLKDGDSVGVMVFSRESKVSVPFTTDRAAVTAGLREAVQERGMGSGTLINPALIAASQYLRENAPAKGRRAIVIVTDNLGLNYQSPDEAATRALHNTNTVLNAIVVGKARRPDAGPASQYTNPDFTPSNVFKISEETGGDAMKADRADQAFPQLVERIRTRYSLGYSAPDGKKGEFRNIRVEISADAKMRYPGATILSRRGYFVE